MEELMSPTHLFIHIRSQAAQVETRRENELRSSQTESGRVPLYVARMILRARCNRTGTPRPHTCQKPT
jgi:hypothetical protein